MQSKFRPTVPASEMAPPSSSSGYHSLPNDNLNNDDCTTLLSAAPEDEMPILSREVPSQDFNASDEYHRNPTQSSRITHTMQIMPQKKQNQIVGKGNSA